MTIPDPTTIRFTGPNTDAGMYTEYALNKLAPPGDYALREGILVRLSPKKATLCTWNTVAALIGKALRVSPEFRAHVRAELDAAEAFAAAAEEGPA